MKTFVYSYWIIRTITNKDMDRNYHLTPYFPYLSLLQYRYKDFRNNI